MRKIIKTLLLATTVLWVGSAAAASYSVGNDYEKVVPAVPASTSGKVEVVELFWYGCPHCYDFDPMLENWLEDKPANVEFIRIPAIFNSPVWKLHAQAFYTAQVLEIMHQFHKPFFDAVQQKKLRNKEDIQKFFATLDIDAKTFGDTFESFAVQAKVRRAADLSQKYGIHGVPSMIVSGKYRVDATIAKSYEGMLEVVDYLIAQESAKSGSK